MDQLYIGNTSLTWLSGGVMNLDGGAMFGVVPKPLWSKKYPSNDQNQILLPADPILVQTVEGINILIDAGLGNGKFTDKQIRNFGIKSESNIENSLKHLGLTVNDINIILMTHLHYDHACGLTKFENGQWTSVFKNAQIFTSKIEWDEMRNPNIRSKNTYWRENWEPVQNQVKTFDMEINITPSIRMVRTGGHSNGHAIIIIKDGNERIIHMADIMPTHAHSNVLWVMAYDDFPLDSITSKQKWMKYGLERNAWFTFYHDALTRAVMFNKDGNNIERRIERTE